MGGNVYFRNNLDSFTFDNESNFRNAIPECHEHAVSRALSRIIPTSITFELSTVSAHW